jgi:hypothetical protein
VDKHCLKWKLSFHSLLLFSKSGNMSEAIGEEHGAVNNMNVANPRENEGNPEPEENSSIAPNVGSGSDIDNRSYPSPSAYSDEPGGRINRTTSIDGSNVQIDSSTSVYNPNMPIGLHLHHLTNTIERLITTIGNLNQNINQFHGDMVTLAGGLGDVRNDTRCLKDEFNNRNVTSASGNS